MVNDISIDGTESEVIEAVKKSDMPEPKKEEIIATMEMYNGPIPHPEILAGFDKLDKGSAKKIIDNGIAESTHRRKMEDKSMKHFARRFYFRFVLAFVLALLFGYASYNLLINDHVVVGSIFMGITFISMLSIFTGENQNNNTKNGDEN